MAKVIWCLPPLRCVSSLVFKYWVCIAQLYYAASVGFSPPLGSWQQQRHILIWFILVLLLWRCSSNCTFTILKVNCKSLFCGFLRISLSTLSIFVYPFMILRHVGLSPAILLYSILMKCLWQNVISSVSTNYY